MPLSRRERVTLGCMSRESSAPRAPNQRCSGWAEIVECLEAFPPHELATDPEGATGKAWVFRGLQDSRYELQPTIEREAQSRATEWPALEVRISREFESRARVYLSAPSIPEDELTWLALMQHYAVPTRLLDFSYSPFVALYFAIRHSRGDCGRTHVRLWAVDANAVNDRFLSVTGIARAKQRAHHGNPTGGPVNFGDLDFYGTSRDNTIMETQGLQKRIAESLSAVGTSRGQLNRQGCVCVALPPSFNPRLSSQQGVFLLNFAQGLSFNESLTKMMGPCGDEWCRSFDVSLDAVSDIERRLFRRNIHEQSLFPDMDGLAGLIRQKIRLHWK